MAYKRIKEEKFVAKVAEDVLGEHTQQCAKRHRAEILTPSDPDGRATKYSKKKVKQKVYFIQGFDLLQYNFVVRDYIVKRFLLQNQAELDVLCYLFPIQLFTIKDFKILPVKQWGFSFKQMKEDGHLVIKVKKSKAAATIYGLSENAKRAVRDYYLYLSGEKTMAIKSKLNPYRHPEQTKADLERERVMLKLKRQSDRYPYLFKNYHD